MTWLERHNVKTILKLLAYYAQIFWQTNTHHVLPRLGRLGRELLKHQRTYDVLKHSLQKRCNQEQFKNTNHQKLWSKETLSQANETGIIIRTINIQICFRTFLKVCTLQVGFRFRCTPLSITGPTPTFNILLCRERSWAQSFIAFLAGGGTEQGPH